MNNTDSCARPGPRAFAYLALGMILFGSATPVSKIVTEAMPVFVGSLLRVSFGALVLAPFALPRLGDLKTASRADIVSIAVIALFGMVGFSAFMLYGMRMISGVGGAVVMAMTPAVTASGAIVFFGEKATVRKLVALALALGGVLILHISGSTGEDSNGVGILGIALIFAAVCCEAAYTLLGRKVSADISPVLVAFLASAASVPLFAVAAAFQWTVFDASAVSTREWTAVAWYGAGTLALGTALWYSGLSRTQGTVAAVFMGLMPVSALALSYVLLGEAFRWVHLLGFGVVLASVLLISHEHMRRD